MTQAITRQRSTARERRCSLMVAWEISPGAAAEPTLGADSPVRLEVSAPLMHGESHIRVGPLSARIVQGERTRQVDIPATVGVCITDAETGLTHIDVPGLLHVSLRQGEPGRPLYARTTLLERLGVAGGRYELAWSELR